jgi:uncharacterized NAD(P)/FAD-binding protein YdhS/glyoxylase-like metal-dependent hydrolase (beta-lactamase superfamily II)/rhodanese-related sulfurtransferase
MSAYADRPDHFVAWAQTRAPGVTRASFLPRALYGEYLAEMLATAQAEAPVGNSITRIHGRVVSIRRSAGATTTELRLADGSHVEADTVVLAMGNLAPATPRFALSAGLQRSSRYVGDPWSTRWQETGDGSVLLVGTGLTAVDVALELDDMGFAGTVQAVSRHGLLPRGHRSDPGPPVLPWSPATSRNTIRTILAELRASAQARGDWRPAVDALRPHASEVWRRLPDAERRRFLRHAARIWEVHRHRLAPEVGQRLAALVEGGRLQVLAGVIEECHEHEGGVDVVVRRRGPRGGCQTLTVDRVVNCTGPQQRLAEAGDPLLDSLFAAGAARPGAHGLGVDVDAEGAVVEADGRCSRTLWAIGPLRRGAEWETTAVREIRLQAAALATRLAGPAAPAHPVAAHGDRPSQARPRPSIEVVALETRGLGNRCHVASDGRVAIVVDPPRDIDRCISLAGRLGVGIAWVLDTHVHNDYVSGGLELVRVTGARYGLAAAEDVAFTRSRTGLRDGDLIEAGGMRIRVVHTPGHTEHHLAYVLIEAATGLAVTVFSGGSWLHGGAGRTDLSGAERTLGLARAQWRSIRRLAAQLPDPVEIRPTHGFGSFCASGLAPAEGPSTVGAARESHPALRLDEEAFVAQLVSGYTAYPSYYARMAPINRMGPAPIDLAPAPSADPVVGDARLASGEWFVDLRPRRSFAASHLPGWLNFEAGDSLATYLGWLFPAGTRLTLAAEDPAAVAEAQRAMAQIGIDRPNAQLTGLFSSWAAGTRPRSYRVASFADLAAARDLGAGVRVLDVRRDDEWRAAHLAGALHVPLPELAEHPDQIPNPGIPGALWVHCASGYRAAVAASWLDARGVDVVLVDDSFSSAAPAGLEVLSGDDLPKRPAGSSRRSGSRTRVTSLTASGIRE